jgi:hypothetical protein
LSKRILLPGILSAQWLPDGAEIGGVELPKCDCDLIRGEEGATEVMSGGM